MAAPRLLPGRMPDELREMTVDVAGMEPHELAKLGAALRDFFGARSGAAEADAEARVLMAYGLPEGREHVLRLGMAYETATGDRLVKGGLVARLINNRLGGGR